MPDPNITTQPVVLPIPTTVKSLIEALIFGAREPLMVRQIQALYEDQCVAGAEPRKIDYEEIARVVEELNADYASADRPYRIVQIAGGYQFATLPAYAEWLGKLYKEQARRKLSQSSVETLAIIAYKQPITKPEIESIRGVNCDYVIKTLLEKDLATIVGRATTVGRPLLYGTSNDFLKHFGLNDINDLPRPREIQEILGDAQFETERRMLEAQQGLQDKQQEEFKSRLPHIPKRKAGLDDDVKIVPKKRIREIKVHPSEDAETVGPGEVADAAPPKDAPQPLISSAPQDEVPIAAAEEPLPPVEFPIIENEAEVESAILEGEQVEAREPSAAMDTSPDSMTNDTAAEGVQETISVAADQPEEPASQEQVAESSPFVVETPQDVEADSVLQESSVQPDVEGVPLEAQSGEVIEAPEMPPLEDVPSSVAPVAECVEKTDATSDQIPHPVSPIIEEHPEGVAYSEHEPSPEEVPSRQGSSQPKSRWKLWKEKIQGFIKKLFG